MTKPIRPETPRLGMRFSDHTEEPSQKPKPRPRPFWYVSAGEPLAVIDTGRCAPPTIAPIRGRSRRGVPSPDPDAGALEAYARRAEKPCTGEDCEPGWGSIAFQIALLHQFKDAVKGGNSMDGRRDDDRQYATDQYPAGQPFLIVGHCLFPLQSHVYDGLVKDPFGSLRRIDDVEYVSEPRPRGQNQSWSIFLFFLQGHLSLSGHRQD